MDSTFEIESNYGKLIGENNKLQKLVTDMKLRWDICQVILTVDLFDKKYGNNTNLLKIVVIGSQSAGKSSVLEKIVGKNFYRPETAVSQSVHCISICFSLIKAAQKFHIMIPKKKPRLKNL